MKEEIEVIIRNAEAKVMQNAPEYLSYFHCLKWKSKKFKEKNNQRTLGMIRGETVILNENFIRDEKIYDVILHELSHKINNDINGINANAHNDSFFKIYEKISGEPQREKYEDGIRRAGI